MDKDDQRQEALLRCAEVIKELYIDIGSSATDVVCMALGLMYAEQAEKGDI